MRIPKPGEIFKVKAWAMTVTSKPATGIRHSMFKNVTQGERSMEEKDIDKVAESIGARIMKMIGLDRKDTAPNDLHVQVASLAKSVGEIKAWLEMYEPVEKSEEDAGESDIEERLAAIEAKLPTDPEGDEALGEENIMKSILAQLGDFDTRLNALTTESPASKAADLVIKSTPAAKRDVLAEVAGIQRR